MRKTIYDRKNQPTIRFYVTQEVKEGLANITKETGVSLQFIFEKYAGQFVEEKKGDK